MQKRLDSSYEKISEAEELISICEDKLYNIQKDKITSTNIYNYLVMFESIYDDLTDMEKKQLRRSACSREKPNKSKDSANLG